MFLFKLLPFKKIIFLLILRNKSHLLIKKTLIKKCLYKSCLYAEKT